MVKMNKNLNRLYLGNDTYEIYLTSGKTIEITVSEWNELTESSPLIEDLKDDFISEIEDLKLEIEDLKLEIEDLKLEIEDLKLENITPDDGQVNQNELIMKEEKMSQSIETTRAVIKNSMGAIRQLNKAAASDKVAWLSHHMPQAVINGELVNFLGEVMGKTNLPDQEFVKAERLTSAQVITDALLNDLMHPLNITMFSKEYEAIDRTACVAADECAIDEADVNEEPEFSKDLSEDEAKKEKKKKKHEGKIEELPVDTADLEKAIAKGKIEKATKILKSLKLALHKDSYKKFKKQIEGL